jgi:hypothetical protein
VLQIFEFCRENGIHIFCFPPKTTHFIQPLDLTVFSVFKHWARLLRLIAGRTAQGVSRLNIIEIITPALLQAMTAMAGGFRRAGIDVVDGTLVVRPDAFRMLDWQVKLAFEEKKADITYQQTLAIIASAPMSDQFSLVWKEEGGCELVREEKMPALEYVPDSDRDDPMPALASVSATAIVPVHDAYELGDRKDEDTAMESGSRKRKREDSDSSDNDGDDASDAGDADSEDDGDWDVSLEKGDMATVIARADDKLNQRFYVIEAREAVHWRRAADDSNCGEVFKYRWYAAFDPQTKKPMEYGTYKLLPEEPKDGMSVLSVLCGPFKLTTAHRVPAMARKLTEEALSDIAKRSSSKKDSVSNKKDSVSNKKPSAAMIESEES